MICFRPVLRTDGIERQAASGKDDLQPRGKWRELQQL
jgi:hypothetical protein